MKLVFSIFLAVAAIAIPNKSNATVTYANCPTLKPLPVTSFMPAAMLPIKNAQNAFEIGINQVVRNAVSAAAQIQAKAIDSSFNSIMQNMIKTSQAYQTNKMEIDRQYQELMLAYEADMASRKQELEEMLFPGDTSMMQPQKGEARVIVPESPSYKFIKQMCSAGKMQQAMTSKSVVNKALANQNRRGQKLIINIQAVSSIQAKAKENLDRHYDIFCSEDDVSNGLCEAPSMTPNADLDAFVFMYPSGYKGEGSAASEYETLYTYSPVESLAAYQYVKHLTGSLHFTPPTSAELGNPRIVRYGSAYKQLVSALSLSSDSLLFIAQNREPINNEGLIMGKLDSLNYLVSQSNVPEHLRVMRSASENGKLVEMQKLLSIQHRLRFLLIQYQDRMKQVKAGKLAVQSSQDALY